LAGCDDGQSPHRAGRVAEKADPLAGAVLIGSGVIAGGDQRTEGALNFDQRHKGSVAGLVASGASADKHCGAYEAHEGEGSIHASAVKAELTLAMRESSEPGWIPSRRIFDSKVVRASPKRADAPSLPPTTPFVSFKT
jgi:hypothetical protein